ncbi:MAG: DUF481 domain-containing protein [Acidobacteria bacterium]|nr:DUF481 domain-containing protein [Acidobacteriota bacterium]
MHIPTPRLSRPFWLILCGFLLLASMAQAQAKRRDVVVMKNGDKITGEIKKLEHGQLYVETDYAIDPIPVDWLQVERVESTAKYQVELDTGQRLAGTIAKIPSSEAPGEDFRIEAPGSLERLRAADIVAIHSKKPSFWRQLKGSVDYGFSYTSGNEQTQSNLSASTAYDSTRFASKLSLSSSFTGQSGAGRTNRENITSISQIFLSRNSFVGGLVDFLTSNQQSLDLRTTLGGGYGRYLIRNSRTQFAWIGGLVFTKELYDPASGLNPKQKNVEALAAAEFSWYRFNRAELQISFQMFPSVSDTGRVRSNLSSSFSFNLVRDLYWKFSLWNTFDSKPPVSAKKNEFGISSGFGWRF